MLKYFLKKCIIKSIHIFGHFFPYINLNILIFFQNTRRFESWLRALSLFFLVIYYKYIVLYVLFLVIGSYFFYIYVVF